MLSAATSPSEVAAPGATATIGELAVGACYHLREADRTADSVGEVDVVSCTSPHDGQVYAKVPLDFADFPGDVQLSSAADSACGAQDAVALDQGVRAVDTISPAWYAPLEADWADSEHVAACVVESDDADGLTRSWTAGSTGVEPALAGCDGGQPAASQSRRLLFQSSQIITSVRARASTMPVEALVRRPAEDRRARSPTRTRTRQHLDPGAAAPDHADAHRRARRADHEQDER